MYVSGAIYFQRKDLTFEELEESRLLLRIQNPEYVQKNRFASRFAKASLPAKWLHFLEKSPHKATSRDTEEFRIPRNYVGLKRKFSHSIIDKTVSNNTTNTIIFNARLREYQDNFFQANTGVLEDDDKILVVPCGHGKTVMALYMTAQYQQKTLVMVPTTYLRDQWVKSANMFLDKAVVKCGDSKQKKLDWEDADVYVITLDLLASRYEDLYKEGFFSNWGHNILDEAHTLGAQTYHPYITELTGKYRTALSATFRRHDGMHVILGHHFGEQYEMPLQFDKAELHQVNTDVFVGAIAKLNATQMKHMADFCDEVGGNYNIQGDIFHFHDVSNFDAYLRVAEKEPSFTKTKKAALKSALKKLLGSTQKPNYPLFDTYIANDTKRYRQTLSLLTRLKDNKRCVLVLSKRKEVLKKLNNALKVRGVKTQLIISETNVKGLADSEYVQNEAEVILGINQLAKEGMDIERLDTLVILNPLKDTEQAIGRILRFMEGKPQPKVYYLCDKSSISTGIFNAGLKYIGNNAYVSDAYNIKELLKELVDEAE